jgi:hypothetical protein
LSCHTVLALKNGKQNKNEVKEMRDGDGMPPLMDPTRYASCFLFLYIYVTLFLFLL